MKIAFLSYTSIPRMGGAQVFAWNLMHWLAGRGHEVHLYVPAKSYKLIMALPGSGPVEVHRIFWMEFAFAYWCPWVISSILKLRQKKYGYDIWQVIGAYPAGNVAKTLTSLVPVVLRTHGDDIQKDEALNYGLRLDHSVETSIKKVLSCATRLVALTASVRECYKELGISEEKIVEIPNAVDLSRFSLKSEKSRLRAELGVSDDELLILSVGRYHLKKGYESAVDAAAILKSKDLRFKWLLVGAGVGCLSDKVVKMKLSEEVILKEGTKSAVTASADGIVSVPSVELIHIYKAADVFVMPSLLETFGMVLIEAMASGVPVVASDAPGCRDVVVDGVNGLRARSGDADSLAECVLKILKDEALKESLLVGARKSLQRYNWDKVGSEYEKLYKELIGL